MLRAHPRLLLITRAVRRPNDLRISCGRQLRAYGNNGPLRVGAPTRPGACHASARQVHALVRLPPLSIDGSSRWPCADRRVPDGPPLTIRLLAPEHYVIPSVGDGRNRCLGSRREL